MPNYLALSGVIGANISQTGFSLNTSHACVSTEKNRHLDAITGRHTLLLPHGPPSVCYLHLSTIRNLQTHQVDYTSAFPQADLDVPVYMRVPQGWFVNGDGKLQQHTDPKYNDNNHYLRLKKNLYGCKQTMRNWFRLLSEGLRKLGFSQSKTDSCLFLRHDCIIIVYVDDCLFFSQNTSTIDQVIASLSASFKLNDEGDVSAFSGVQISKDIINKSIRFTQPGLIDQILRDVGLTTYSKGKDMPCDSILHPDPTGPEHTESWNYRSVIGKLNYLANNT